VPLEAQAATTNNLGLGTPFAGKLEVYPVYRMEYHVGLEQAANLKARTAKLPTIVRGVLLLPEATSPRPLAASLLDISGRKVLGLHPGANDLRTLAPGVYFVREAQAQAQAVRKVIKLK
jgi:hypothetical protein